MAHSGAEDRYPGQFKERAVFLVSRSLKLPAAPPWAEGVIWRLSSCPQKNKKNFYRLKTLPDSSLNPPHCSQTFVPLELHHFVSHCYPLGKNYRFITLQLLKARINSGDHQKSGTQMKLDEVPENEFNCLRSAMISIREGLVKRT